MYEKRVHQLRERAKARGIDAVALIPGPNLFYFTGAQFFVSERPIVLIWATGDPPDNRSGIVIPGFEAVRMEEAATDLALFDYTDEEGYEGAFRSACETLGLAGRTIGVEYFTMRLVEARLLEQHAPGINLVPAEETLADLRMRKDEHELAQMRRAVAVTQTALKRTIGQLEAGMTERQLASLLVVELLQGEGELLSFTPIVAAGPNAAIGHHSPSDTPIPPGAPIIIDCGAVAGGYAADITRTFFLGEPEPEMAEIYQIVKAANAAGRAKVGPGIPAEEVDQAARAVIEDAGYGAYFTHRTGHGLGLQVHEPPYIVAGNQRRLEPGMTFTVEPGIYIPGRGGVRIEDDVVITEQGAESLTSYPRELTVL